MEEYGREEKRKREIVQEILFFCGKKLSKSRTRNQKRGLQLQLDFGKKMLQKVSFFTNNAHLTFSKKFSEKNEGKTEVEEEEEKEEPP